MYVWGFNYMSKKCLKCGGVMDITLRSIYFNKKVEIKNVPVFSCEICSNDVLMEQKKVKSLLEKIKDNTNKKSINFDSYSELAQLIIMERNAQGFSQIEDKLNQELVEIIERFWIDGFIDDSRIDEIIHKKLLRLVH